MGYTCAGIPPEGGTTNFFARKVSLALSRNAVACKYAPFFSTKCRLWANKTRKIPEVTPNPVPNPQAYLRFFVAMNCRIAHVSIDRTCYEPTE